jgi:DNA-binding transcriptional LysR family regulator
MNLRQLECFKVLAEELNFTRAAAKLHMAQPPLSRQIKLLEDTLGVALFERTKRSVRLTAEGTYLKKEIGQTFRQLDNVKAGLKEMQAGRSGTISVGYVGAAMHSVLPGILKKFLTEHKDVTVHLHEMDNTQQLEALKNGTIDVGFVRSRMQEGTIELRAVYEEPFILVTPKSAKLQSSNSKDVQSLATMPFIGFPMACAPDMVKSIYSVLHKLKLNPKQIHESSQINSILRIVESGIGYAILPASAKNAYKLVVNSLDLNHVKEKAVLYIGSNKERQPILVRKIIALAAKE